MVLVLLGRMLLAVFPKVLFWDHYCLSLISYINDLDDAVSISGIKKFCIFDTKVYGLERFALSWMRLVFSQSWTIFLIGQGIGVCFSMLINARLCMSVVVLRRLSIM